MICITKNVVDVVPFFSLFKSSNKRTASVMRQDGGLSRDAHELELINFGI